MGSLKAFSQTGKFDLGVLTFYFFFPLSKFKNSKSYCAILLFCLKLLSIIVKNIEFVVVVVTYPTVIIVLNINPAQYRNAGME